MCVYTPIQCTSAPTFDLYRLLRLRMRACSHVVNSRGQELYVRTGQYVNCSLTARGARR